MVTLGLQSPGLPAVFCCLQIATAAGGCLLDSALQKSPFTAPFRTVKVIHMIQWDFRIIYPDSVGNLKTGYSGDQVDEVLYNLIHLGLHTFPINNLAVMVYMAL
jgi:hypothetical protein